MKRFAVSWIGWHDNDLTTEFTLAHNELEALQSKLAELGFNENAVESDLSTVERCKQLAFDCDCMIHAAEIPNE